MAATGLATYLLAASTDEGAPRTAATVALGAIGGGAAFAGALALDGALKPSVWTGVILGVGAVIGAFHGLAGLHTANKSN